MSRWATALASASCSATSRQLPNCINIFMLPFNDPRSVGKADRRASVAAVDVNTAAKRGNSTLAHEVGHLFDLDDKYRRDDDGNVTDKGPRGHIMSAWHRGRHVTKEECRKIWDSIDRFRGS